MRRVGAVEARLRRWLREDGAAEGVSLSREDVEHLLADIDSDRVTLQEFRERLEAALQAHAAGGPGAMAGAMGIAEFDGRSKVTVEEAADILTDYWYAVVRNGLSPKAAAERIRAVHAPLWPSAPAFRAWLRRAVAELRDPDSPLRQTFNGAVLDPDKIPPPDGRD